MSLNGILNRLTSSSRYTIWDRGMVKELLARKLVCSWLGHRFAIHKMHDDVCSRCSTSRRRR